MYKFLNKNKSNKLLTAIDIGSSKITCLIAEKPEASNRLKVIGNGQNICKGFNLGNVTNINELSESIAKAVSSAEKMAGTSINKAQIVLNGGKQFSATYNSETTITSGEITNNEINKIIGSCIHDASATNYKILHALPVKFKIDNSSPIKNPKGMVGHILEGEVNICKISESVLSNIAKVIERNHIDVEGFISSTLANGFSCLLTEEKSLGSVLVDFGSSSTGVGVYYENNLIYSFDIPLGGHNITKDVATGLATSLSEAERIKVLHGNLYNSSFSSDELINIANVDNTDPNSFQTVSIGIVNEIVKARVSEIFELIEKHLKQTPYFHILKSKVVFTGGSSQITGLAEISSNYLSKHTRISTPSRLEGLPDAAYNPNFASVIGTLLTLNEESSFQNNLPTLNEKLNSFHKFYQWISVNIWGQ